MSERLTLEDVTALVIAQMQGARDALRNRDMERVVCCLKAAVALYEENPSYAREPGSQLLDVLVCARSVRSLCKTVGRPSNDLRTLEERAEALRRLIN